MCAFGHLGIQTPGGLSAGGLPAANLDQRTTEMSKFLHLRLSYIVYQVLLWPNQVSLLKPLQ